MKQNLLQLLTDPENPPDVNDVPVLSSQSYEAIMMQPDLLVGKRIQHQFEVDKKLSWFHGTVLKMNSTTKEFEVIYDGEEETCWFTLLEDLSAGNLYISV